MAQVVEHLGTCLSLPMPLASKGSQKQGSLCDLSGAQVERVLDWNQRHGSITALCYLSHFSV
jgi:hypothetical protein